MESVKLKWIRKFKRNPQAKSEFHLQFADSTYYLRISLTILRIPLTICGFHNSSLQLYTCLIICLWTPQTVLDSAHSVADFSQIRPFVERFWAVQCFKYLFPWNPKQQRRSRESSNIAYSATNLILDCCEVRLQCTECTGWPRNVRKFCPPFF